MSVIPATSGAPSTSVNNREETPGNSPGSRMQQSWDRQTSRVVSFFSPERGRSRSANASSTRTPSPSSVGSHSYSDLASTLGPAVVLGVCAMDIKARSKAMREIVTRLVERARGGIEVKVFGDKVILDEGI